MANCPICDMEMRKRHISRKAVGWRYLECPNGHWSCVVSPRGEKTFYLGGIVDTSTIESFRDSPESCPIVVYVDGAKIFINKHYNRREE